MVAKGTAHLQGLKAILSLIFLGRFNKVAVVAALFQLHHNVQETRCAPPGSLGKSFIVSCQNPPTGKKVKALNHSTVQSEPAGASKEQNLQGCLVQASIYFPPSTSLHFQSILLAPD